MSLFLSPLPYLLPTLQCSVWQFIQDKLLSDWGALATDGGYSSHTSGRNMTPQFKTHRKVNCPNKHLLSIIQQSVPMFLSLFFLSVAHTASTDLHKSAFPYKFGHLEIAEGKVLRNSSCYLVNLLFISQPFLPNENFKVQ